MRHVLVALIMDDRILKEFLDHIGTRFLSFMQFCTRLLQMPHFQKQSQRFFTIFEDNNMVDQRLSETTLWLGKEGMYFCTMKQAIF